MREAALRGSLRAGLAADSPRSLRALERGLDSAAGAVAADDAVALGAAYGTVVAALRTGAFDVALTAARSDRPARARAWLLIRDFREPTRYTRAPVDATAAIDALAAGERSTSDTVIALHKDLYDAYQSRLLTYLDDARTESQRGYLPAVAESAALARGYWRIIADEYEAQKGADARRQADAAFDRLVAGVGKPGFAATDRDARQALARFTAAPLTPEEQARRSNQLLRFLDLVPVEYDHGTDDGEVTIPFELQEGIAFTEAARSALGDLAAPLEQRDEAALTALEDSLAELDTYLRDANEGGEVVPLGDVEAAQEQAIDLIEGGLFPDEWLESSEAADYDLIQISLDQMESAVSAGEYDQAEQARLTAYAFFEFGPEIELRAFDPGLATEVEGLIWYGANGTNGLAELIAGGRGITDVRETRIVLDERLDESAAKTGEGESGATVISNAALIVFREGLEAILIIAAITASMIGPNRRLRAPVMRGALLALPATAALFVAAVLLLDTLSQYGEKLEAVVGVIAIGVLLLVLNWFFHKVYWTEWISSHRRRGKALVAGATVATTSTIAGLYVLGFTSVFREGFETVLFLQALQLSSGTGIVLAGVSLGLLLTAAVGYATFKLERKLPYKKMLIVTGVLIALVLVVLVGNTVRTLQGVGWVPITPLDVEFPLWTGTWLGIFPTVETLAAQFLAFAFVVGSYFAAEWVSKRRLRQLIAAAELSESESEPVSRVAA